MNEKIKAFSVLLSEIDESRIHLDTGYDLSEYSLFNDEIAVFKQNLKLKIEVAIKVLEKMNECNISKIAIK
jgi:hypothetical protein